MKLIMPKGANGMKFFLGVSGGPDSVSLLMQMADMGYRCVVGHCNFHLRGDFEYEFNRYEQAPSDIQDAEVKARAEKVAENNVE